MVIEFEVSCFDRTLRITFPDGYEHLRDEILEMLDAFYYEWHHPEDAKTESERNYIDQSCCEEYMMERLSQTYAMWTEWSSVEDTEVDIER